MDKEEYAELRVLVVEDDRASRMLVVSHLEELGVGEIKYVADGEAALRTLRGFHADVIVCDIVMEPIDGVEFARRVRTDASSPNPYVPVILISAHVDRTSVEEARDAGVNTLLTKPIQIEALRKRLDLVLNDRREFIMNDKYVGPDRRRQDAPLAGRPDRRKDEAS